MGQEECLIMAVVVWLSGLLGILPVGIFGKHGVMAVVRGWFVGTALKLLISVGVAVLLVKSGGYALNSVMLTLAVMYLAMLPVSMFFVLNYLRAKDGHLASPGASMETSV